MNVIDVWIVNGVEARPGVDFGPFVHEVHAIAFATGRGEFGSSANVWHHRAIRDGSQVYILRTGAPLQLCECVNDAIRQSAITKLTAEEVNALFEGS